MPCKRQLDGGGVDHEPGGLGVVDEHGLGEAEVRRDGLTMFRRDVAVEEHTQRVAAAPAGTGEDAQNMKLCHRQGAYGVATGSTGSNFRASPRLELPSRKLIASTSSACAPV